MHIYIYIYIYAQRPPEPTFSVFTHCQNPAQQFIRRCDPFILLAAMWGCGWGTRGVHPEVR